MPLNELDIQANTTITQQWLGTQYVELLMYLSIVNTLCY
jgi:hypothetical protein